MNVAQAIAILSQHQPVEEIQVSQDVLIEDMGKIVVRHKLALAAQPGRDQNEPVRLTAGGVFLIHGEQAHLLPPGVSCPQCTPSSAS